MHRFLIAVLAGALAIGGVACGSDDEESGGGDRNREVTGGSWTLLAYSIADTDLEPFMMDDITEMGGVGSGDGLEIVALVDRAAGYSDDPVLGIDNWEGAKLLHVGQGEAEVLEDVGDLNTGDPEVLANFIAQGVADFPSDHYALVISDHGAAWPGVGGDESADHDGLGLAEIEGGIAAGIEKAGIERLDMIGFDACLMASYEVASALAPYADRMLASQELEPGHGWGYQSLDVVTDDGSATVDELGSALIQGFAAQAEEQGTSESITLSLIDLTLMEDVDAALSEFSAALAESGAEVAPVVGRERAKTLAFGRNPNPEEDTHMADLGLLAGSIGEGSEEVAEQADAVVAALASTVVDSVDGASTRGATGLSIYFPPVPQLRAEAYSGIDVASDWGSFLDAYYAAGEAIPEGETASFVTGAEPDEVFFDEDGVNIVGTFEEGAGGNLTEAIISYGIVEEDGSVTYIGEEPATIADDGSSTALGSYDLTALTISDGEDTTFAYLALAIDEGEGIATVDVPMAYYADGDVGGESYQDVLLELTFDVESGDLLDETYYVYNDELGTYGELSANPEGIIVPEVLNLGPDGEELWIPTSDFGLFADLPNLQYDLEPLESGLQLQVDLTVFDFGGNSGTVSAVVDIP